MVAKLLQLGESRAVRVLVTASLLCAIALIVDWEAALRRLEHGHPGRFAAAVAAELAALLVGAVRWALLLRGGGVETSLPRTARAYFIGVFSNNFLPTGFGGDALRAFLVAGSRAELGRAAISVLVDRLSSFGCFYLVGWAVFLVARGAVPGEVLHTFAWLSAAGLVLLAVAALLVARARVAARFVPLRFVPPLRTVRDTVRTYARDRRLVVLALLLGCVYQLLMIVATWQLAASISLGLGMRVVALVVPVVVTLTLLPVSIAGIGVREGGYIALLGTAGVSSTDATLLSLLTVAALALASLPGAAAILFAGGRRTALRASAERVLPGDSAAG